MIFGDGIWGKQCDKERTPFWDLKRSRQAGTGASFGFVFGTLIWKVGALLYLTLFTPHSTLYTPHSFNVLHIYIVLNTPLCILLQTYTPHSTLHSTLCTLHTPNSTLLTPHFYTPHSLLTLSSWVVLFRRGARFFFRYGAVATKLSVRHWLHSWLRSCNYPKCNWVRVALSRSVIPWGGTSGMPRSFWHAFSKSLVAVSISSPVQCQLAIDLAMWCSAACSRERRKERKRGEREKMWVCEDVSARERREDVSMWRWADVKMSRCEDEKMWR